MLNKAEQQYGWLADGANAAIQGTRNFFTGLFSNGSNRTVDNPSPQLHQSNATQNQQSANNSNAANTPQPSPGGNTAAQIVNSGQVTFGTQHPSPAPGYSKDDNANANDNMNDAANNRPAQTSPYSDVGSTNVSLNDQMLQGMQTLSESYTFGVSEITGGDHSDNSRHYVGTAFDVTSINGQPVSADHPDVAAFMKAAKAAGATEVLGPGTKNHDSHVHVAWPRPSPQAEK